MSKNKDLVNLLRNIKYTSVSKIDMKYNKIFKEYNIENIIEHNKFANQVRKKCSNNDDNIKMKIITTNHKLKQIINTNKNASKIQELFFKTFDKRPIFKKINKKDKDKLISKDISSKIKNIIENRKKFNISNTFLKRRQEENNRSPPICLYTPKYSYIYKHTPGFNFEKTISRKKDTAKNNELLSSDIINISKDTNNNSSINEFNSKKKYIINSKSSNKIIKTSLSPIHLSNRRSHISLLSDGNNERKKENEENKNQNNFNKNQNNFFLSQQFYPINGENENKMQDDYSPKLIEKNVFVPNFDKMLPRFIEKAKKRNQLSNIDYSPNYNVIFCNVLNNNPIDYKKRKKYYKFKKIITIYNPTSEYLLFPELNLKE